MVTFNYSGDALISMEEREESKKAFQEKLGPFWDEFEDIDGTVTIHFERDKEDENYYTFNIGGEVRLSDFIARFNEYIKSRQ